MPSLVLEDSSPVSEFQFLCRSQTLDAIEEYLPYPVLTKKPENLVFGKNSKIKAIKQDITIENIQDNTTLLMNFLQYTPYEQTIKMMSSDYQNMLVFGGF
ncbi:MAG: hypothetical protein KC646_13785 [Candidatus Cloacimonetes bacterium]|nr:hypothetical protein [Candidatus Cloacimonadota bacterium]